MLPGVLWGGSKISKPGIYAGVPMDAYHGDLCVDHSASHGGLDRIITGSPKHYFDRWYGNPDREPDEPTKSMILGKAAHHLFLGEREFAKHFIRRPEIAPDGTGRKWNGNNNACIDWLELQAKKKLTVLTLENVEAIMRMNKALAAEPLIQGGILNGHIEQSFVWKDSETGLWMKARPDVVPNTTGDFVDLKVIADISDEGMQRSIHSFGYHRQGALTIEGAAILLEQPPVIRSEPGGEGFSWTLVFVEADRPHCVRIRTLKIEELQDGMKQNRLARRLLKRCIDRNEWPGPDGHQRDADWIERSPWQKSQDDYRMKLIERQLAIA